MAASPMVTAKNPTGLSSTALIMQSFMPVSEKKLIALESLKTDLKNILTDASSEALEKNNQQFQELLTKAAAESPSLYQAYMGTLEKLKNAVDQIKNELSGKGGTQKGEPLSEQYEKIAKKISSAIEKNSISETEKEELKKQIADLSTKIKDNIETQKQIKAQQELESKRFAQEANNSGIPVQPPKLN